MERVGSSLAMERVALQELRGQLIVQLRVELVIHTAPRRSP